MNIIDILLVLSITNLITYQKIVREYIILKIFDINKYLDWNPVKRFFFNLISCSSCLGFHLAWIYELIKYGNIDFIYPLIIMYISYLIEKIIK